MVNRIEKAFESFRSVMVQMPTGTGKTHVIADVAKRFVSESKTSGWSPIAVNSLRRSGIPWPCISARKR